MVGSIKHGAALLAAMVIIFASVAAITINAEHHNNPAVQAAGIHSTVGNTEGKEVRFGDTSTALFATASTQTSTGSRRRLVRLLHARGRLRSAHGHDARRSHPGWHGSGLYTLLIYAIWLCSSAD